jgi:hypothetical protein
LELTKDLKNTYKETLTEEWYRLFYDKADTAPQVTEFAGKTEPAKSSEVLAKRRLKRL